MAPVLSRSLASASVAPIPHTAASFSLKNFGNSNRVVLRSAILPRNRLKNSLTRSGLEWKLERRERRVAVRCEAAAVAEKEAADSSEETREYQAEVLSLFAFLINYLLMNSVKLSGTR